MLAFYGISAALLLLAFAGLHIGQMSSHLITSKVGWLIGGVFFLIVIGFYQLVGGTQSLEKYYQHQSQERAAAQLIKELKTPEAVVARLKAVIAEHPNEAQGYFLLGRLYISLNQAALAATNFKKANTLKPNDPEIMLQYAQSLFLVDKNRLTSQSEELLQAILAVDPQNEGVINLLALNAYEQKKYQQAINYWQQLLAKQPPDSDNAKSLRAAIANATNAKQSIG